MRRWISSPAAAVTIAVLIVAAAIGVLAMQHQAGPTSQGTQSTMAAAVTPHPSASQARERCTSREQFTPDSRDPWGGCWPGPDTVGVPDQVKPTPYEGPCTITTDGTVIDEVTVKCTLVIQASRVKVRRSKILGGVLISADWPNEFSVSVTDSEIGAPRGRAALYDGVRGIGKNNFVVERTHIYGGISGAWCEFNCVVRDSYIHGQGKDRWGCTAPNGKRSVCLHQSGIRLGSGPAGSGQLIEHSTIVCDAPQVRDRAAGEDSSGCSANLTGYGDFVPIQNNTVHRNLLLPTEGGTCVYGGSTGAGGEKPHGAAAESMKFTENYFVQRPKGKACGYYFSSSDFDASRPGNEWRGNRLWNAKTRRSKPLDPNS